MLSRLRLAAASVAVVALLVAPGAASAAQPAVAGDADDAVVVLSGNVVVEPEQTVDGVYVASGDVRILGHVTNDVVVLSGDVLVSGRIDGDLFTASGETRVEGAEIGGDVVYADEHPEVSRDSLVGGEVKQFEWPDIGGGTLSFLGGIVFWIAITVSLAVLGSLLILMAPRAADAIEARSHERAGPTIAIGIAIGIALPIGLVLVAITVLGLPLAVLGGLALLPLLAVGYCAAAHALGRRLVGPPRERVLSYLAGLGALQVAGLVPFLDIVVGLAATIYGLGLMGAAIGAARKAPAARTPDS